MRILRIEDVRGRLPDERPGMWPVVEKNEGFVDFGQSTVNNR